MVRLLLTCPELVWEWEPMLWFDSSRLTRSSVGTLPLDLDKEHVPAFPASKSKKF